MTLTFCFLVQGNLASETLFPSITITGIHRECLWVIPFAISLAWRSRWWPFWVISRKPCCSFSCLRYPFGCRYILCVCARVCVRVYACVCARIFVCVWVCFISRPNHFSLNPLLFPHSSRRSSISSFPSLKFSNWFLVLVTVFPSTMLPPMSWLPPLSSSSHWMN